jgi:predicted DNA-binding transcriptional regulator AlpA
VVEVISSFAKVIVLHTLRYAVKCIQVNTRLGTHLRIESTAMKVYLSVSEVADRTGLALNTVKAYSQDTPRRMPNPDAMIGRVKGWTVRTIDAWHKGRRSK